MVGNQPANAGDMGLIPGLGRSHMPRSAWAFASQLLSPRAAATEASVPRARALQQEKPITMRSPHTAMKTQRSPPKIIN